MKILITGGKSAIALKVLKAFENHEIIVADYGDMPLLSSPKYQLKSLGEKNEDIIAHHLLNQCLDLGVDLLLPLHQFEIEPIAKAQILFDEFNVHVLLPDASKLNLLMAQPTSTANWLVILNGEIIYRNNDMQVPAELPKNGAFFLNLVNDVVVLGLIRV